MQKSKNGHFEFILFNTNYRNQNKREGESKLAENIRFGEDTTDSKFVILGISEDIGPQMNLGLSGANLGFDSFCKALQNVQANKYYDGHNLGILGEIVQCVDFVDIKTSKGLVEELDEYVLEILQEFVTSKQKLIVIGGGHNNAFPIIKHVHNISNKKVQVVNIDPHADCRTTEYRHSGNPFSHAFEMNLLDNYAVFGLHESYNNRFILDFLKGKNCTSNTFETFLDSPEAWYNQLKLHFENLDKSLPITLDIDLDAIAFCPSSALSPSGFSIEDIRKIIRLVASKNSITSLHLPEGAPKTEEELRIFGKMATYFVMDFIKCQNKI